jgi:CheY-like chemotaxis protein
MNGYEATERIRDDIDTSKIPVIALTASTKQREIEYRPELFDGYIRKPFQKRTLLSELIRFLPHKIKPSAATGDSSFISGEADNQLSQPMDDRLKDEFNRHFLNDLTKQSGFLLVDELTELIQKMSIFATEHQQTPLIRVCDELRISMENFDFDQIQKGLAKIRGLTG